MRRVPDPGSRLLHREDENERGEGDLQAAGAIAEFPHAWIKEKIGLRQFHLRGLLKVGMEALWACLTYNIQQWIRLCWRPRLAKAGM